MSELLAGGALRLSIATVIYGAGSYGQRIKALEAGLAKETETLELCLAKETEARERLRDRIDGLATKDDLKDMESRIESRIDDLKTAITAAAAARHG